MSTTARLSFVGLGTMGMDLLRQAVQNKRASIISLCDVDNSAISNALEIAPQAKCFNSFDDVLKQEDCDGVIIATPPALHAEMTIQALENGMHVYCEKPMALSIKDCVQMEKAVASSGRELMIGHVLQYIGLYRYILELVRSGEVGSPMAMRVIRTMGKWGHWIRPWRLTYEESGGTLMEVNIHEIDLMLRIINSRPVEVSAYANHFVNDEVSYEDYITLNILFEDGQIGSVTSSCCDTIGRNTGELYCSEASIYYDSIVADLRIAREGNAVEQISYEKAGEGMENGVYREVREFIETCLGEHLSTIPGKEGRAAVEICEAAYISAREKCPVKLPLRI